MNVDKDLFDKIDTLSLQLKRKTFGKYKGEQGTVYAGDGLAFKDFIPYTRGDDIRHLDWRIYARTRELFVKRFEEDRNLTIHLLVDASASMGYGSRHSKFKHAVSLALGVSYLALRNHEKVGFSLFDQNIRTIKNANQQISMNAMVGKINAVVPHGKTDLAAALTTYRQQVQSKSLLFIFSDFLFSVESLNAIMGQYARSQIFVVQVLHEDELRLPMRGDHKFVDPEQEKNTMRAYVSSQLRHIYVSALDEHVNKIKELTRRTEAGFVQVSTQRPIIDAFIDVWKML